MIGSSVAMPAVANAEAGGQIKGVAIAIVTQNAARGGDDRRHVELGKVKVRFPWHSEPRESHWARIAVPMAGKERGLFLLPEVGDEVLVAFEREDIRHPYIVGCLWNGKDRPPAANLDGNNDRRVLCSRKGHRIVLDDGDRGAVRIELKSGGTKRLVTLDDDGVRIDDGGGSTIEIKSGGLGTITITAKGELNLAAPRIKIAARTGLEITSGGDLKVQGTMVRIN